MQRRERGMTWNELANEPCVSMSTIKGMTKRPWGIELDGVMGMTRWAAQWKALQGEFTHKTGLSSVAMANRPRELRNRAHERHLPVKYSKDGPLLADYTN
jgi:hypothetical protein